MNGRKITNLRNGWKFSFCGDESILEIERNLTSGAYVDGPAARSFDDSTWSQVEPPHDFVVERKRIQGQAMGVYPYGANLHAWRGSYETGVGWYRRRIAMTEDLGDDRFYLIFDGVFRDSRVYVNDFFVANHPSGYTSFWLDISDFLEAGTENLLVVRADARGAEGWYYEGGGIYRPVNLVRVPAVHVIPYGVQVITEIGATGASPAARLFISTEIKNSSPRTARVEVVSAVIDPFGQKVAQASRLVQLPAGELMQANQEIELAEAILWDLENPNLYRLETTLILADGEISSDNLSTNFGIRSASFDPDRGFLLNGQVVKIQGTCCHQDHAGVGVALTMDLQEYRLRLLKEMGCNAIRTAHHPPAPELLDACDRLGLLVMTENRRLSSADEDLRDLEALIRIDRNHPSVVIRSLGNEEVHVQQRPQSARIARRLIEFSRQFDPTRPSTLGLTYWNIATHKPDGIESTSYAAAELDVMGFNYSPELWEQYHLRHPRQPIIVSEASSNLRTRGCYATDDSQYRLSVFDARAQARAEEQWLNVATYNFLSGIFVWTGFDYRGEPIPFDWPAVGSNFGLMDLCGFPKDNYYYYRSAWRREPLVHLFPHWNWPDRIGQPLTVSCHSNCEAVELFVNGKSLGRKPVLKGKRLDWEQVNYEPGRIEALGYQNQEIKVKTFVETTGPAEVLRFEPKLVNAAAGRSRDVVVNIHVVDALGRTVPTAEHLISFQITGPGHLVGTGNGDPTDHTSDKATERRAFGGLCQAIVRLTGEPGVVELTAESPGLTVANLAHAKIYIS